LLRCVDFFKADIAAFRGNAVIRSLLERNGQHRVKRRPDRALNGQLHRREVTNKRLSLLISPSPSTV
jgi:hypothetical protein